MLILEASDEDDIEVATERLAHDDRRMTVKLYRRKPRRARAGRKWARELAAEGRHRETGFCAGRRRELS